MLCKHFVRGNWEEKSKWFQTLSVVYLSMVGMLGSKSSVSIT